MRDSINNKTKHQKIPQKELDECKEIYLVGDTHLFLHLKEYESTSTLIVSERSSFFYCQQFIPNQIDRFKEWGHSSIYKSLCSFVKEFTGCVDYHTSPTYYKNGFSS